MDAALKSMRPAVRNPLLLTALTPVIPQILGSIFNIWYNLEIVDPLLRAAGLRERFVSTVIVWNAIAFPAAVLIWLRLVFSTRRGGVWSICHGLARSSRRLRGFSAFQCS